MSHKSQDIWRFQIIHVLQVRCVCLLVYQPQDTNPPKSDYSAEFSEIIMDMQFLEYRLKVKHQCFGR